MDFYQKKTSLIAGGFFLSGIIMGFITSCFGTANKRYTEHTNMSVAVKETITYLDSLTPSLSAGFQNHISDIQDTAGNQYAEHLLTIGDFSWATNDNGYAIYYLGGNYHTLSGIIAMNEETWNGKSGEVSVLCDNHLIYTTGNIDRTSTPTTFSLNIQNCQWLTISQTCYTGLNIHINFILHNWKLE